jgi:hypothetical protein
VPKLWREGVGQDSAFCEKADIRHKSAVQIGQKMTIFIPASFPQTNVVVQLPNVQHISNLHFGDGMNGPQLSSKGDMRRGTACQSATPLLRRHPLLLSHSFSPFSRSSRLSCADPYTSHATFSPSPSSMFLDDHLRLVARFEYLWTNGPFPPVLLPHTPDSTRPFM